MAVTTRLSLESYLDDGSLVDLLQLYQVCQVPTSACFCPSSIVVAELVLGFVVTQHPVMQTSLVGKLQGHTYSCLQTHRLT